MFCRDFEESFQSMPVKLLEGYPELVDGTLGSPIVGPCFAKLLAFQESWRPYLAVLNMLQTTLGENPSEIADELMARDAARRGQQALEAERNENLDDAENKEVSENDNDENSNEKKDTTPKLEEYLDKSDENIWREVLLEQ